MKLMLFLIVLFIVVTIILAVIIVAIRNTTSNFTCRPEKYCGKFDIDVVITWVDSSDDVWIKNKSKYTNKPIVSSYDLKRFGSDGISQIEIEASTKSVLKNMPWIRKIWIVTDRQVPEFMNKQFKDKNKINIIYHDQFFSPNTIRPTFNSHAIEANIHKISGLSEQFIYINDDFYVTKLCQPSDFFYGDGIPCYRGYFMINVNHKYLGSTISWWFGKFFKDSIAFMKSSSNLCDVNTLLFFRQLHHACPMSKCRMNYLQGSSYYRLRDESDIPPIHQCVLKSLNSGRSLYISSDDYSTKFIDTYKGKIPSNINEICINHIQTLEEAQQLLILLQK